jgi:hypothetical protein
MKTIRNIITLTFCGSMVSACEFFVNPEASKSTEYRTTSFVDVPDSIPDITLSASLSVFPTSTPSETPESYESINEFIYISQPGDTINNLTTRFGIQPSTIQWKSEENHAGNGVDRSISLSELISPWGVRSRVMEQKIIKTHSRKEIKP